MRGRSNVARRGHRDDSRDLNSPHIYQVRGNDAVNIKAVQVDKLGLNSKDTFIIHRYFRTNSNMGSSEKCYIWIGKGSNNHQTSAAKTISKILSPEGNFEEISEELEPESFWKTLGGSNLKKSSHFFRTIRICQSSSFDNFWKIIRKIISL